MTVEESHERTQQGGFDEIALAEVRTACTANFDQLRERLLDYASQYYHIDSPEHQRKVETGKRKEAKANEPTVYLTRVFSTAAVAVFYAAAAACITLFAFGINIWDKWPLVCVVVISISFLRIFAFSFLHRRKGKVLGSKGFTSRDFKRRYLEKELECSPALELELTRRYMEHLISGVKVKYLGNGLGNFAKLEGKLTLRINNLRDRKRRMEEGLGKTRGMMAKLSEESGAWRCHNQMRLQLEEGIESVILDIEDAEKQEARFREGLAACQELFETRIDSATLLKDNAELLTGAEVDGRLLRDALTEAYAAVNATLDEIQLHANRLRNDPDLRLTSNDGRTDFRLRLAQSVDADDADSSVAHEMPANAPNHGSPHP